mmetsp:Transcript_32320/g.32681  ORF Transcript_32320/g.32681 Transcript_32320/m.32681 type:complete len:154 (+) Transcript_32320:492-953(+)
MRDDTQQQYGQYNRNKIKYTTLIIISSSSSNISSLRNSFHGRFIHPIRSLNSEVMMGRRSSRPQQQHQVPFIIVVAVFYEFVCFVFHCNNYNYNYNKVIRYPLVVLLWVDSSIMLRLPGGMIGWVAPYFKSNNYNTNKIIRHHHHRRRHYQQV